MAAILRAIQMATKYFMMPSRTRCTCPGPRGEPPSCCRSTGPGSRPDGRSLGSWSGLCCNRQLRPGSPSIPARFVECFCQACYTDLVLSGAMLLTTRANGWSFCLHLTISPDGTLLFYIFRSSLFPVSPVPQRVPAWDRFEADQSVSVDLVL